MREKEKQEQTAHLCPSCIFISKLCFIPPAIRREKADPVPPRTRNTQHQVTWRNGNVVACTEYEPSVAVEV